MPTSICVFSILAFKDTAGMLKDFKGHMYVFSIPTFMDTAGMLKV